MRLLKFALLAAATDALRTNRRAVLRQASAGTLMVNLPFQLPSIGRAAGPATNEVVGTVNGIRRKRLGGSDIVVSEVGARHMHDPERLNRSAQQVYGPLYDSVYGPCAPIAEERIHAVADGDRLDLGGGRELELLYTPGHAKHHIGVLDTGTGAIFSGDSVGVKLPGMNYIRPATPPADFHLDAALDSLARYQRLEPSRLYLAHYGPVDPPDEALGEAIDRLRLWASTAEEAYRTAQADGPTGTELDHVSETLAQRFASELDRTVVDGDPDGERRLELLSGVRSNAAGLVRYFQRRDDGTLTPVG